MTMAAATTLTIARRFSGPPDSANGGYVCGLFTVVSGGDLCVRLLTPPPLEQPLVVENDAAAGTFALRHADGRAVATGTPVTPLVLEVPHAPPYVQAVWASQHYVGFRDHDAPDCFVCGPRRRRGDGLRIFPGMLDSGIVAAPWIPADDLDAGDGKVAVEHHWAALDCPGYFAITGAAPRRLLLGEMQAHVDRRVHVGEPCTVIGWSLGGAGRKHYSGTALFDEDGELCARARATWVAAKS